MKTPSTKPRSGYVLLAVLIPVCAPILLGYALFALHVVARRLLP